MDIEGGEWPILADERFSGPPLLVLEYHPTGCPSDDPHGHVDELLHRAGYDIVPIYRGPDGHGMLWGIRR
jgi:hypothetical protein